MFEISSLQLSFCCIQTNISYYPLFYYYIYLWDNSRNFLIFRGSYSVSRWHYAWPVIFFIYHIPVYYWKKINVRSCCYLSAWYNCDKKKKKETSINYHANCKYLSKHPLFSACIITRHVTIVDVFIVWHKSCFIKRANNKLITFLKGIIMSQLQ